MALGSYSNIKIFNLNNICIKDEYNKDCCEFIKSYFSGYSKLTVYFNPSDTTNTETQIYEYVNKLQQLGLPYIIEDSSDSYKYIFSIDISKIINYQEGYTYFIFLRYLWSSYYKPVVNNTLTITNNSNYSIFESIQLALHLNKYPESHSLYYTSHSGNIKTYSEFCLQMLDKNINCLNNFFTLYNKNYIQNNLKLTNTDEKLLFYNDVFPLNTYVELFKNKEYEKLYLTIQKNNNCFRYDNYQQMLKSMDHNLPNQLLYVQNFKIKIEEENKKKNELLFTNINNFLKIFLLKYY